MILVGLRRGGLGAAEAGRGQRGEQAGEAVEQGSARQGGGTETWSSLGLLLLQGRVGGASYHACNGRRYRV